MVRKYKGNFYTEVSECFPRMGDLVELRGTVGVLRSEWDQTAVHIETERGDLHQLEDCANMKLLRPVKANKSLKLKSI